MSSLFLHLLVLDKTTPGVFGFKYMTSFLFALGIPLSVISFSLLLKFAAYQVSNEYGSAFRLIANLGLYVGSFYLLYTFIPMQDFSRTTYYAMLLSLGYGLYLVCVYLHRAVLITEEKLKKMIRLLFKGFYDDLENKDLINPLMKKEFKKYRIKLTDEVIKNE